MNPSTLTVSFRTPVPLDPAFLPAVRWRQAYRERVAADPAARPVAIALLRPDGTAFVTHDRLLSAAPAHAPLTVRYVERWVKTLLWQKGGSTVLIAGADEIASALAGMYAASGARAFDADFMGPRIYRAPFSVRAVPPADIPPPSDRRIALGRHLSGCRIGFDLGGSDRKAAAVIDGKVVFSEEIPWSPYFERDPLYHLEGVQDSLARAAAHLPRVDAIGGSAAGVYVNNEVRVGSLYRGVSPEDFEKTIRPMFATLRARWGGVPFEVAKDGEVTALAGAMWLDRHSLLGVSMGTSQAGGYVDPTGQLTTWLNELAFVPIDYSESAPSDEWSGDRGCGVNYFSQQGVARLALRAGFELGARPLPEQLIDVQKAMEAGDPRAEKIYRSLGVYFGHTIALYGELYELGAILLLGRVTSGPGGELILATAREVLRDEYPAYVDLTLCMPDEHLKRHGQAIAAASLPSVS